MGWHTILKVRMHYGPVNGMKVDFERFWNGCLIMKINHYLQFQGTEQWGRMRRLSEPLNP